MKYYYSVVIWSNPHPRPSPKGNPPAKTKIYEGTKIFGNACRSKARIIPVCRKASGKYD